MSVNVTSNLNIDNIFDTRLSGKVGNKQKTKESEVQNLGQALEDGKLTKEEFKTLTNKALEISGYKDNIKAYDGFVKRMSDIMMVSEDKLTSSDFDPSNFNFNKLDNGSIVVTDLNINDNKTLSQSDIVKSIENRELGDGINVITTEGTSVRELLSTQEQNIKDIKTKYSNLTTDVERASEKKLQKALINYTQIVSSLNPNSKDFETQFQQATLSYNMELSNIHNQKSSLLIKISQREQIEINNSEKQFNNLYSEVTLEKPIDKTFKTLQDNYNKKLEQLESIYNDKKNLVEMAFNQDTQNAHEVLTSSLSANVLNPDTPMKILNHSNLILDFNNALTESSNKKFESLLKIQQEFEEEKSKLMNTYENDIKELESKNINNKK